MAPFAFTEKFAGTLFGGSSRVPQLTSTVASYVQLADAVGRRLKYASFFVGPPQPPVSVTLGMRGWLSALPSFQTRI